MNFGDILDEKAWESRMLGSAPVVEFCCRKCDLHYNIKLLQTAMMMISWMRRPGTWESWTGGGKAYICHAVCVLLCIVPIVHLCAFVCICDYCVS